MNKTSLWLWSALGLCAVLGVQFAKHPINLDRFKIKEKVYVTNWMNPESVILPQNMSTQYYRFVGHDPVHLYLIIENPATAYSVHYETNK